MTETFWTPAPTEIAPTGTDLGGALVILGVMATVAGGAWLARRVACRRRQAALRRQQPDIMRAFTAMSQAQAQAQADRAIHARIVEQQRRDYFAKQAALIEEWANEQGTNQ